jgi:hypothetical protein
MYTVNGALYDFERVLGFDRLPVEPLNLAATAAEVALVILLVGIVRNSTARRETESCPQPTQRD